MEGNGLSRIKGVVKFYNEVKGYGFAETVSSDGDVFIHANELKSSGIERPLKRGANIEFDTVTVKGKGRRALNISVLPQGA